MKNIIENNTKATDSGLDRVIAEYCADDNSVEEAKKFINYVCNRQRKNSFLSANIIIEADSSKRAYDFLNNLMEMVQVKNRRFHTILPTDETSFLNESFLNEFEYHYELYQEDELSENSDIMCESEIENTSDTFATKAPESEIRQMHVLTEFESLSRDTDPKGTKIATQREAWKKILKKMSKRQDMDFAICTDFETLKERFVDNTDKELNKLFNAFYIFRVTLRKRTSQEIYCEISKLLKNNGLRTMRSFEKGLESYVNITYPESGMNPDEYLNYVFNALMKNIYSRPVMTGLFSANMLPKIKKKLSYEEVSEKIDRLTGLKNVKKALKELGSYCLMDKKNSKDMALHFVFSGNAGTGKTTVARLMAELLNSMGVITENKLIEVSPDHLTGRYIGDVGRLVRETCRRAYGGILFIDEAYAINPAKAERNLKEVRQEALSELMKEMENNRDKLVVIFAGYKKEMDEFMDGNPGLKSRIFRRIEFEDFSEDELLEIFKTECEEGGYTFDNAVLNRAKEKLHILKYEKNFGNARSVRAMFYDAQFVAIEEDGVKNRRLKPEHIKIENNLPSYEKSRTDLMELIGLENVKKNICEIASLCRYNSHMGKKNFPTVTNMLFTGNPGTGKTTVAELFGNMLFAIGAVSAPKFVSVNAYELNSNMISGVSEKLMERCREAMGGVLFIDEAYALGDFGNIGTSDAVNVLLDVMENHREDIIIILAGYRDKMDEFLKSNRGLRSRVPTVIHFDDYNGDELEEIFVKLFKKSGFSVDAEARSLFRKLIEAESCKEGFANARTVRNIYEKTYKNHAVNIMEKEEKEEGFIITEDDMPDIEENTSDSVQIGFM